MWRDVRPHKLQQEVPRAVLTVRGALRMELQAPGVWRSCMMSTPVKELPQHISLTSGNPVSKVFPKFIKLSKARISHPGVAA